MVLGDGGSITLVFDPPIGNGPGFDFAVFENSFSDTFLELAFVEVSSDGIHFTRFPNYSLTPAPVGGFGIMDARMIYGLAGKYRLGFGTPFDLQELADAFHWALSKPVWEGPHSAEFSQQYRDALVTTFPFLDLNNVRYVRIIDIIGDGSALDAEGFSIYDPHPTLITAGFDLSGVAVLNQAESNTPTALPTPSLTWVDNDNGTQDLMLQIPFDPSIHAQYQLALSTDLSIWTVTNWVTAELLQHAGLHQFAVSALPVESDALFFRVEPR